MDDIATMLAGMEQRRREDEERWQKLDKDLCQLCHAYGADKRTLTISCGYAIAEVVPEAIDLFYIEPAPLNTFYRLNICKSCRSALLRALASWRAERIMLQPSPKDHDGRIIRQDSENRIPVRFPDGAVRVMSEEEYRRSVEEYRQHREGPSNEGLIAWFPPDIRSL